MDKPSLSVSLSNSIGEKAVDCISSLGEVGLDAIMDEGILKDIPLLSMVVSTYHIGKKLTERHHLRKLVSFIEEINKKSVDEENRIKYIAEIKNNPKKRNAELEYILVLVDRYMSEDKAKMLAKLYLAYLDGGIIWEELTMYAEVIDRFLLLDSGTLISSDGKVTVHRNIGGESVLRLEALGLMTETNESSIFSATSTGIGVYPDSIQRFASNDKTYRRTEFGNKLAEILK